MLIITLRASQFTFPSYLLCVRIILKRIRHVRIQRNKCFSEARDISQILLRSFIRQKFHSLILSFLMTLIEPIVSLFIFKQNFPSNWQHNLENSWFPEQDVLNHKTFHGNVCKLNWMVKIIIFTLPSSITTIMHNLFIYFNSRNLSCGNLG